MELQRIIFPSKTSSTDKAMFFRIKGEVKPDITELNIEKGQVLSLESYFNAFSIGKWMKYTRLDNLKLQLDVDGDVEVKAYNSVGKGLPGPIKLVNLQDAYDNIGATRSTIPCNVTKSKGGVEIEFPELPKEGILYVKLRAKEDTVFRGGYYHTDVDESKLNDINLALCICTFKREKELDRNMNMIIDNLMENKESPLYHNVSVYISDNGHTLGADRYHNERIHIFENKNAGGAGGFTRTMIESVYRSGEYYTHIILMDDDIELDTFVIDRTYRLLRMIKKGYKRAVVGGAMLELKRRYKQFEAGATLSGIEIYSYNHGWDLRRKDCIAANEAENDINYTGWWYCCIPTENIRELGLPLPQFIHYDDIEYGVRNSHFGIILMNGLCVWHPYGMNKQAVSMNYYDFRNAMIAQANTEDPCTTMHLLLKFMDTIWTETLRYRYNSAECFFLGLEDYFKGPEHFMHTDPVDNHKWLATHNDVYEDPFGIDLDKVENISWKGRPPHCMVWGALCWFLPPSPRVRYIGIKDSGVPFFTRKLYFYDENRKQGFWMERDYGIFLRNLKRSVKDGWDIVTRHKSMTKAYKDLKPVYTGLEFWEKYLEI